MSHKVIPISQARKQLLALINEAHEKRFILTRKGKPEIVILSYEDYESLLETLEIYQTPGLVAELEERARKRGKVKPLTHAQVWRR